MPTLTNDLGERMAKVETKLTRQKDDRATVARLAADVGQLKRDRDMMQGSLSTMRWLLGGSGIALFGFVVS